VSALVLADGGKTFPFRGKGIGVMPSLDEVLQAFPDRSFQADVTKAIGPQLRGPIKRGPTALSSAGD
jgi:hypothetical protein